LFLALDAGLEIIPVLNKIDLPGAEPERRAKEIHELIGAKPDEILRISAKEGTNVPELLEAVVRRVPPPRGKRDAPLRALIFDSYYDRYRGAIPSIRVVDGVLTPGMKIAFGAHPGDVYEVDEVGYLQLGHKPTELLEAGEVGYFVANIRGVRETQPGDTVFDAEHQDVALLPGYREVKSMVFAGLYATNAEQFEELRDALAKLQLNDASLHYEPESSVALGFGFRCGFLGLLHMEIVRERLEREFNLDLISTVPNVEYHVHKTDGAMDLVENPSLLPHGSAVDRIEEPYVKARIVAPAEYIGAIMKLGQERRGVYGGMHYVDPTRVDFTWEFPLAEIILDFYDKLKTISRGYASLDYEFLQYRPADLVKLDMLRNGEAVDAFSVIIHRDKAYEWGKKIAEKLKELIPRQLFEVVIQAAIGTKVIARETVRPLRKNVTAKCFGGDVTRKRKLLHALLSFFLLLEQLALARHVAPIALGGDVLAQRADRLAGDHFGPDRGLDHDLEQLARDQLFQLLGDLLASLVRFVAMDDDRERVHRVAVEQHVELDEVGRAVLEELIVERRIATGDRLQLVVEVEDDLGEREFPAELDARRVHVMHALVHAAPLLAQLHDAADVFGRRYDPRLDVRLLDVVDGRAVRHEARVLDQLHRAVRLVDVVLHVRHGADQVEVELPLEPLAHDLHVEQPEEAAAKPEAECHRRLGLVVQRPVVELELGQRVAQLFELLGIRRVQAGEHHRHDVAVPGQERHVTVVRVEHRIAGAGVAHTAHVGDEVADFTGLELLGRLVPELQVPDLIHLVDVVLVRAEGDLHAGPDGAVHDADA